MRIGARRAVSWAAIYAIALRAILLGVVPVISEGGAAGGDPFTVICHSDGQAVAPTEQAPVAPNIVPGHPCEHCNLCSASVPPPAPDGVLGTMVLSRVAHVLRPTACVPRIGHQSDPKLARGPPQFA